MKKKVQLKETNARKHLIKHHPIYRYDIATISQYSLQLCHAILTRLHM